MKVLERKNESNSDCPVKIQAGTVTLDGDLCLTANAQGIVLFAHGSGSSRNSPRNRYVARVLRKAGLATLLFDLLTAEEEEEDVQTAHFRFDIQLLAGRLNLATDWLKQNPETSALKIGYFGASTGAAAALVAAAERTDIRAIVSRGGRPDLAGTELSRVKVPTLLIVGSLDSPVISLNRYASDKLQGEKKLVIVPGATHLFEEIGVLEEVAWLAANWFLKYLSKRR